METISTTTSFRPQTNRMNPDDYAQQYATENNISLDEAKTQLGSKYGTPESEPSIFNFDNSNEATGTSSFDISELGLEDNEAGIKSLFQKFLDFLKGGNGPQNEGDPQSHLNPLTGEQTGPQKEGDFNPNQNQDPDSYAQTYADENGLTLEEAKAELKAKYGDPQEKQ